MASAAEQLAANLNFSSFAKATELRQRIWFTLGALIVFRLGTYIPMPGINPDAYASAFDSQSQGMLGMFNMLAGGAIGRRLDFLAQEFGREANTLCAKANDISLSRIGLDLKAVVEQFREQVQNIE